MSDRSKILCSICLLFLAFQGAGGCLKHVDVTSVTDVVSDAVVGTADAVSEIALTVIGTGAGVVIEMLGGEGNGRSCPSPKLIKSEKWMERLDPGLRLKDLVLPGVHHHGLIEGHALYKGPIPGGKVLDWAVTQSISVPDQLRTGARFLDIRLTKWRGKLVTAHGREHRIVTLGVPFDQLLSDHITFLQENKREILVWNFMWENGEAAWDEVEDMLDKFKSEYFYTGDDPLEQPLSVLAGRIILCREDEDNLGSYRVLNCTGSWPYTMDKDPTELVENIKEYSKHPADAFNYIEAVATIDIEGLFDSLNTFSSNPDNLKDLACQVNSQLLKYFLTEENRDMSNNFHSVMVDYSVYYQVVPAILEFNAYKNYKNSLLEWEAFWSSL